MMESFARLGLRGKLFGMISIPVISLLVLTFVFWKTNQDSRENLRVASDVNAPLMQTSMQLSSEINLVFQNILLIAASDADSYSVQDVKKINQSFHNYLNTFSQYELMLKAAAPTLTVRGIKEGNANVQELVELIGNSAGRRDLALRESREAFLGQIRLAINPLSSSVLNLRSEISKVENQRTDFINQWGKDAAAKAEKSSSMVFAFSISVIVITLLIVFFATHRLQVEFSKLREVLVESGSEISLVSENLTATSSDLAQRAQESSAAIQTSSNKVDSLSQSVLLNVKVAQESSKKTQRSQELAKETVELIDQLNGSLKENEKDFEKMAGMLSIIDDITFQTNLLALNAAVEAARAGENGKGFAVVADAVRNLAHKTAEASSHISSVIQGSMGRVKSGSQLAERSIQSVRIVSDAIQELVSTTQEVVTSSHQQSEHAQDLVLHLSKLDELTEQNTKTSQDVALKSDELSHQSQSLKAFVLEFNSYLEGQKAA